MVSKKGFLSVLVKLNNPPLTNSRNIFTLLQRYNVPNCLWQEAEFKGREAPWQVVQGDFERMHHERESGFFVGGYFD